MLSLKDIFEVSSALGDRDLDVDLRALLGFRAWHMCVEHEGEIGTDVQMFVVFGGDSAEVINDTLAFRITGPQAEEPAFLTIEDHQGWFEISYARDDQPHTRIFVEDGPATELGLHYMCLAEFWSDDEDVS